MTSHPGAYLTRTVVITVIFAILLSPAMALGQDTTLRLDPEWTTPPGSAAGPMSSRDTTFDPDDPLWMDPTWGSRDSERSPTWAAASVGSVYLGLYTWAYFAWYKGRDLTSELVVNNEGWFETDTYAGGADKLGHMYSNYVLTRASSDLLQRSGWEPLPASLVSTGLTLSFFTAIEIKDGYHEGFGFSWGDMAFNTLGNALAVVLVNSPTLDEHLSLRVEYLPTDLYLETLRRDGVLDVGEDYSGQTFMLAWHLKGVEGMAQVPGLAWTRYTDVVLGFQSLNYLPEPVDAAALPEQRLFVGLSLNLQTLLDDMLYTRRHERLAQYGLANFVTEVYALPYTTLRPDANLDAWNAP